MTALFELHQASVRYNGRCVLKDIDLSISPGEKVALVGRSGAGKSSLLRLLHEQVGPQAALIPQELGLVKALSVFHNVYMGQLCRHNAFYNLRNLIRPVRREVEAIVRVLRRLDLEDKLFESAGELSGGQQQRTAVARALHQHGVVVLADEPVSSVDEHQSRRVLEAITGDHETVVLAMHDTGLAIRYATRLIGLEDGRIAMDRSTQGLSSGDLDGLYGG